MATLSSALATVPTMNNAAVPVVLRKTVSLSANVADGDIAPLFTIPAGHEVYFGIFMADDMDTGTEALDIDIGWTANGGAASYDINGTTYTNAGASADPDGFVNTGVLSGDAITDLLAAGSNIRIFPMVGGPKFFGADTLVQAEANAAAATFAAGTFTVILFCGRPLV